MVEQDVIVADRFKVGLVPIPWQRHPGSLAYDSSQTFLQLPMLQQSTHCGIQDRCRDQSVLSHFVLVLVVFGEEGIIICHTP